MSTTTWSTPEVYLPIPGHDDLYLVAAIEIRTDDHEDNCLRSDWYEQPCGVENQIESVEVIWFERGDGRRLRLTGERFNRANAWLGEQIEDAGIDAILAECSV